MNESHILFEQNLFCLDLERKMSSNAFYYQNPSTDRKKSQFHYDAAQDPDNQPNAWFSSTYSKLIAACVGVICIVAIVASTVSSGSSSVAKASVGPVKPDIVSSTVKFHHAPPSKAKLGTLNGMSISVVSPGYGELKAATQLEWKYIAEPARTQVLQLKSLQIDDQTIVADDDTMQIAWTVNGESYSGSSIEIKLPSSSFGTKVPFTVTVSAKKGKKLKQGVDNTYTFTMEDDLVVKYVRREFRTLTTDDKSRFVSAMQKVYSLSDEEGQKLYGAKFHNAEYFLLKHLTGAGRTDCDHWHDGAGLVPHHTAFTLEMEQTLQAIDPTVSIPYWEYGMDAYLYTSLDQSPIFDVDFLGKMNPMNDDHRIDDGSFWSTVTTPSAEKYSTWSIKDTASLNPYRNAYGAMRSPWNNNPSPYIGRHNTTYDNSQYSSAPSCSSLQDCFQSDGISDMNYCLNGITHGPVHIMIGGAWGDEDVYQKTDYGYLLTPNRILFFKILWRMGYTRCPDSCDIDKPDTCRCSVPQEYIDKYGAKKILTDANVVYVIAKNLEHATDEDYLNILRVLEHPGQAGEMFTSGAPFDPTFWPLHGSMERMIGLKRLLKDKNVVSFDETWGYPEFDKSDGAAYLPGVCDWSGVASTSDLTLPTCNTSATCVGHSEDDVLEFSNFLNRGETYTNVEFYTFLHPNNLELPYVYDTYDFDYCSTYGYDFLDESSSSRKTLREGAKKEDISSAM